MFRIFVAGVACIILSTLSVAAEKPVEVKADPLWKGSVDDLDLLKDVPMVISDAKTFQKVSESWKFGKDRDPIDFTSHFAVIVHGRGSTLDLRATLDEKGDLKVVGFGTKDLRPGFRFVVGVVKREGVKTINGKEIPKN